ncbi:BED zinc finger [Ancylostoma ceylanicum]|uniref:BED zinc finger n=1 Tax=Ancylostoma ceylanicum TaxID=53326 RepID=A0A0D6M5P1_9BILA|nr:BED zinc finger [Ancylostoma ceylanicum]
MFNRTGLAPAPNVPNPRNAGRKKSNPVEDFQCNNVKLAILQSKLIVHAMEMQAVWEFFTDLRGHGLAGVRCRFCHWVTNDRSPTTMKFHLKRKHDTGPGGLWAICEEKINSQAPANYAPRSRKSEDALLKALTNQRHQMQAFNPFATADVKIGMSAQDDFLTSLIQQATSMSAPPAEQESFCTQENESLSLSESLFLSKLNEGLKEEDGSSSSASGLICPTGNDFQLSDGASIAALLQIATDSDLTFTFNSRRCGEYCFESNRKNGRMVVFGDTGAEIRVAQKIGDEEKEIVHMEVLEKIVIVNATESSRNDFDWKRSLKKASTALIVAP